MPLSEQEQRLLEEMERSLYHNDADFVASVSPRRGKPNYTSIVVGILLAILGIATIVTGVAIRIPIIGVGGFVLMFVGVLLALSSPRRGKGSPEDDPTDPRGASTQPKSDFMDRLNERWDKRNDEQ